MLFNRLFYNHTRALHLVLRGISLALVYVFVVFLALFTGDSLSYLSPVNLYIILFCTFILFLFLVRPELSFYLCVLLMSFKSLIFWLWGDSQVFLTFAEPLLLFALMVWCLSRLVYRKQLNAYKWTGVEVPLVLLFILGLVSLLWTGEQGYGIYMIYLFFSGLLLFFLTNSYVNTPTRFKTAMGLYLFMALLSGFLCFYVIVSSGGSYNEVIFHTKHHYAVFWFNPEQMLRGQGFMHPLKTAYYLSMAIIFALGFSYTNTGLRRWVWAMFAFFLLSALTTTLSKGPLLSLLIGVFFITIEKSGFKKYLIPLWIFIMAMVIIAFIVPRVFFGDVSKAVNYTSQTATSSSGETSSLGSRLIRWSKAVGAVYDTYGVGVGTGGFRAVVEPYQLLDSSYFHVFMDFGFVGLWLWLWFLLASGLRFYRTYKACPDGVWRDWMLIYVACYISLLFNGLTSETHFFLPLWFIVGLGHGLSNVVRKFGAQRYKYA